MRGRNDDAVGQTAASVPVGSENRVRNHRRRRVPVVRVNHGGHAIGREHFQRAGQCRDRQCMGIDPDEQRPGDAGTAPMLADRLADG
jgi:hypothetical protein